MLSLPKKQINGYYAAFLCCFVTALVIFLPFLIVDKGFFLYCGDFNSQQIPFYYYCHNIMQNGGASYSFATDLGGSFLTSYSFYLLGSPAFWLSLFFPQAAVPYLMVPLLCLKFGFTGVFAYAWIKRYVKTRNYALCGALLYCFSGFSVYNIFFNHFIEPIMMFPLFLWSMDRFFIDKKRGSFTIVVAVNLFNSFFFFAGNAVFCILYFIIMVICRCYRPRFGEFLLFCAETLLGVMIGAVIALPTAFQIVANPRTLQFSGGFGLVMYSRVQQYFAIISSLFLPPDPPYLPNIFTEGAIKWTSLSAYIPLCGFSGVLCYFNTNKGTAFGKIIKVCMVMALVPILNSAFYCLNSSYYARWYYMPLLIMCAATVIAAEHAPRGEMRKAIGSVCAVTCCYLIFAVLPHYEEDYGEYVFGVAQNVEKLFLSVLTALLGLLIFYLIIQYSKDKRRAAALLLAFVMGFSALYGIIHISLGKFPQWERDGKYKEYTYDSVEQLNKALPNDHYYRIDAYECFENMGLWLNKSCIQCFNSTVAPSILEFYPSVGVKRDVSSKPELSNFALRGLLSVEYIIMPQDKLTSFYSNVYTEDYEAVADTDYYTILKNKNYVPMGFCYDYYVSEERYEPIAKNLRSAVLMNAIVLNDEQISKYGDMLSPIPEGELLRTYYGDYLSFCAARRQTAATKFKTDNYGFTAEITLDRDNLVFFSLPYDEGFTAYVNGKETPVEKVSGGLIAIPAEKGENVIRVDYSVPHFKTGLLISAAGLLIWLVYFAFLNRADKKAKLNAFAEKPTDENLGVTFSTENLGIAPSAENVAKAAVPENADALHACGECDGYEKCEAPTQNKISANADSEQATDTENKNQEEKEEH